jgi:ATP synthase F1 delta subunit
MNMRYEKLAHKYAVAFLNLYSADISKNEAERIYEFRKFLEKYHQLVFVLTVPIIHQATKDELLAVLFKQYQLPSILKKVCDLLFEHKRIDILPMVLRHIWWLYLKRNDMMHVYVESSMALTDEQKKNVEQFMHYKQPTITGIYTYKITKDLIAGIRIHSATILWDSSLRYKLNRLKHLLPS